MQPVWEMALQPRENLRQVSYQRRHADGWNLTLENGKCLNKYIYIPVCLGCTSFSNEAGNRSTHLKWNTIPTAFIKLSSLNYYSRSNKDVNCNSVPIHILLHRNSLKSFPYPFWHYPSKMGPLCLQMRVTWYCCCCYCWITCWNESDNKESGQ